ncbi:hypothetical protein MUK42_12113 [Musa troglodytarum]|uniref:Uncharacterized protein n=1 Tax=Musa troglodytarum TaxID=320322 RepID=A0A9E7GI06_9LILI|nr:hypothetical protein MUK42_12113 [Musa troglodytarum]
MEEATGARSRRGIADSGPVPRLSLIRDPGILLSLRGQALDLGSVVAYRCQIFSRRGTANP